MKKNLLFCLAFILFTSTVMANDFATSNSPEKTTPSKTEKRKKAGTAKEMGERTFHIMKCTDSESKFFLMIGKKPDTKVTVKVYDKGGILLHTERINAKRDFATILNLEGVEGAIIRVSDSNGVEKDYTI